MGPAKREAGKIGSPLAEGLYAVLMNSTLGIENPSVSSGRFLLR